MADLPPPRRARSKDSDRRSIRSGRDARDEFDDGIKPLRKEIDKRELGIERRPSATPIDDDTRSNGSHRRIPSPVIQ